MAAEENTKGLFNMYGIRRTYDGLKYNVGKPDWRFRYNAPQFFGKSRFAQVLAQFAKHLPVGSKLPKVNDFYSRFMAIIETIAGREDVSGIMNGPCLPLVFATGAINTDLGEYLEKMLLPGVKSAYMERFKGRTFNSFRKGHLVGRVDYMPETNLSSLFKAMKDGPVAAAYFPDALRSWSIRAGQRQMETLPPDMRFVLSDAIINSHAIIGYPDVMARDYQAPGQRCAANTYQSHWFSLGFWAADHRLGFTYEDDLGGVPEQSHDCSIGLLLLG